MNKFTSITSNGVIIILLCVLLGTGFSSCSNEEEALTPSQPNQELEILTEENRISFYEEFDSLNRIYLTPDSRVSSGLKGVGTATADLVGEMCGSSVGKWLGGALGSLTGNPVGTVVGVVVGGKVGRFVCGAAASGIADAILSSRQMKVTSNTFGLKGCFAFGEFLDETTDSMGYYHNVCMLKLNEQRDKYVSSNKVNTNLLYNDVVQYYKTIGIYETGLEDFSFKLAVIHEIETMCETSVQYELGNITQEDLMASYENYLRTIANFSESEITKFKRFAFVLIAKCAEMNEEQTNEYAANLNLLIRNSTLSEEDKVEMATIAQFVINSSLCWQQ